MIIWTLPIEGYGARDLWISADCLLWKRLGFSLDFAKFSNVYLKSSIANHYVSHPIVCYQSCLIMLFGLCIYVDQGWTTFLKQRVPILCLSDTVHARGMNVCCVPFWNVPSHPILKLVSDWHYVRSKRNIVTLLQ